MPVWSTSGFANNIEPRKCMFGRSVPENGGSMINRLSVLPAPLRWRAVHLEQRLRVKRLRHRTPVPELAGIKIPVMSDLTDNICVAIYDGHYESAELHTFQSMLDEDDVVLEVGAGIGFLSSYCARAIGSEKVHTYEANPKLEVLIRKVYAANQVGPTLKIGVLGQETGTAQFFITHDFWASSLLPPAEPSEQVTVPVYDVNEEIRRITPTFLLMDIEGGEYELIKALDFHTIRKISVEMHTDVLGQARVDESKAIMRNAGFEVNSQLSRVIPGVKEVLFLERRERNR